MKYSCGYNGHYDHFRYCVSEMALILFPPQNFMRMPCYHYWLQDCRATSTRKMLKSNLVKIRPVIFELRNMAYKQAFLFVLQVYASHAENA
jgi:hypothetical protein